MSIALTLPVWLLIWGLIFVVSWIIQLVIQIVIHRAPIRHAKKEAAAKVPFVEGQPSVSVIVYSHNQGEELLRNLPIILDNDYPDFEVIVVDDGSTDFTSDVLTQMQQRSENFSYTTLSENVRNVSRIKMSMMLGMKAAKNEIVLMTHAQCMPVSNRWIANMVRQFTKGIDVVLGPSTYESRTGAVNKFYQWDLFQRMNYMMGLTLISAPYDGWGTNMAIRKSLFFANHNEGLSGQLNIHPGHDDLFIKAVYHDDNVTVECSADAVVLNQQSPIRYAWKKDRLNRAFTSTMYLPQPKSLKHLDTMSRYATVILGWTFFVYGILNFQWIVLGVATLLLGIHYLFLILTPYQLSKRLGMRKYPIAPWLTELVTPLVDVWFRLLSSLNPDQFYVARINR